MDFNVNELASKPLCRISLVLLVMSAAWVVAISKHVVAADLREQSVLRPRVLTADDHPPVISALAFHPDGKFLVAAGDDHLVRVWDTVNEQIVATLTAHSDWVHAVSLLDGGTRVVTVAADGKMIEWDWQRNQHRVLLRVEHALMTLAVGPRGDQLVAAGFDSPIYVFDRKARSVTREIDCDCGDIRALAMSPDGDLVAAGGRDGRLYMVSTHLGRIVQSYPAHERRLRAIVFDATGDRVITGGDDRSLCVWDVGDGKEIMHLQSGSAKTMALCMLGADRVVSAGSDNQIRIWDLRLRSEVTRGTTHSGSITVLAVHENVLASGGFDAAVRVWSLPDDLNDRTANKQGADSR